VMLMSDFLQKEIERRCISSEPSGSQRDWGEDETRTSFPTHTWLSVSSEFSQKLIFMCSHEILVASPARSAHYLPTEPGY
jgi:hypothetical protein